MRILGNLKHKPLNGNLFIDGFEKGRVKLSDIVMKRKSKLRKSNEEAQIRMAINYFTAGSKKRRKITMMINLSTAPITTN